MMDPKIKNALNDNKQRKVLADKASAESDKHCKTKQSIKPSFNCGK